MIWLSYTAKHAPPAIVTVDDGRQTRNEKLGFGLAEGPSLRLYHYRRTLLICLFSPIEPRPVPRSRFLQKPFNPETMLTVVKDMERE